MERHRYSTTRNVIVLPAICRSCRYSFHPCLSLPWMQEATLGQGTGSTYGSVLLEYHTSQG